LPALGQPPGQFKRLDGGEENLVEPFGEKLELPIGVVEVQQ